MVQRPRRQRAVCTPGQVSGYGPEEKYWVRVLSGEFQGQLKRRPQHHLRSLGVVAMPPRSIPLRGFLRCGFLAPFAGGDQPLQPTLIRLSTDSCGWLSTGAGGTIPANGGGDLHDLRSGAYLRDIPVKGEDPCSQWRARGRARRGGSLGLPSWCRAHPNARPSTARHPRSCRGGVDVR